MIIVPRLSWLYPVSSSTDEALSVYNTLRGDRESLTAHTSDGQRYRAYRDGRGVTVCAGKRVVYLHSPHAVAGYVARLRSSETLGSHDERETLASLIESVVLL